MDTDGTVADSRSGTTVPQQRTAGPEIVVALTVEEAPPDELVHAAHLADAQDLPLDLLLVRATDDATAPCMAALDQALHLVREAFPTLEVRVHDCVEDPRAWLRAHAGTTRRLFAGSDAARRAVAGPDAP